MSILDKTRLLQTSVLTGLLMGFGGMSYAQDQIPVQPETINTDDEDDEFDDDDQIVVTGSRIRRNEYTSISPIQIISGEISRDLGLVEADEVLRQTTVVQGQQTTIGVSTVLQGGLGQAFTTFGSVTPSLRGLSSSVTGRSRNLILVNGRRLGPIGVGGAPANPDVSLIPGSLINNVELLLDGASSIYGSDAIAGVINYQLRDDIQGLELDAFFDLADQVDEETLTLSATAGWQSDNGFAVFAAEYRDTTGYRRIDRFNGGLLDPVQTADFGPVFCDPEREINTATGEIFDGCNGGLADFTVFGPTGTTVVTPGTSNIGINNFSSFGIAPFDGVDSQGTFGSINNPFTRSFPQDQQEFVSPPVERFSIYSLGEYETELPTDLTAFYEVSYAQRELNTQTFNQGVLEVTENTPFNPGLGGTLLVTNLQQETDQIIDVFRATGGVKGNLDFLENVGLKNWDYEAFALYHRSKGTQRNFGDISNIQAARVLNGTFDENGQFQCALDETLEQSQPTRSGTGGFTTAIPNCQAVNFFDPQFLTSGRFADQASNDFLLATAIQNTDIEQVTFNAFATGDLFDIPFGGTVQAVVGYEHRFDKVETINDFNQSTSNALASLNPDVGSIGDRTIDEFFGELVIPLVRDKPFVNDLTIELAGRLIDEENFGTGETYQIKGNWSPVDWINLSAGFGTSFRAPDTGESFGTGIVFAENTRVDPCLPPVAVLNDPGTGVIEYDGSFDERSDFVINLCNQLGVVLPEDGTSLATINAATALGLFGIGTPSASFQNFSVLVGNGGSTNLTPETSEALFLKATVNQPWFDAFDLSLSVNYYDYEVEDSIGQLTDGTILAACFSELAGTTTVQNGVLVGDLCEFQTRNPDTGLITNINESSFNLGSITSKGFDINGQFNADLDWVGDKLGLSETPRFGLTYRATRSIENEEDITGNGIFTDLLDTFGFPEFQQNITANVRYGNLGIIYNLQHQNATGTGIAPFGGGNVCAPTLIARGEDPAGCTEFLELPDVELHNVSLTYNADTWAVRAGIRNIANTVPVRDTAIPADGNTGTPFGLGYDANGRNFFVNVSKRF